MAHENTPAAERKGDVLRIAPRDAEEHEVRLRWKWLEPAHAGDFAGEPVALRHDRPNRLEDAMAAGESGTRSGVGSDVDVVRLLDGHHSTRQFRMADRIAHAETG